MSSDNELLGTGETVEFGWQDEEPVKELGGRRKKELQKEKKAKKPGTFESMGLSQNILRAIKRKGYRLPTPIQRKSMPLILQGMDVVGMARTGSGKTAAFVIPMIHRLQAHSSRAGARALVLSPTRELALQTHKAVREMARFTDLRTAVLVGGDALEAQFAELATNPDIMVATPGRLMHHLAEVAGLSLKSVEYVVLDEADRLFEMGFAEQVTEILSSTSSSRQTLLFSATLPASLADFAQAGLQNPRLLRLDTDTKISPELQLVFLTVRQTDKLAALMLLLESVVSQDRLTLVFTSTRYHVEFLHTLLQHEGIQAAYVHGNMDQTARKIQIAKFRAEKVKLLVVTDVAARGIDIPHIDNVINVDFPGTAPLFIHRVGRAARMGRTGTAYSLVTRDEIPYLLDLHLYLSRSVKPAPAVSQEDDGAQGDSGSLYGSIPLSALEPHMEKVRSMIETHSDLIFAQRSLENSYRLYLKTRPSASAESVRRAKHLGQEGVHPMLLEVLSRKKGTDVQCEKALSEFTEKLKSFRPAVTVLEAEVAPVQHAGGTLAALASNPALLPKMSTNSVMMRKRSEHAHIIEKRKRRRQEAVQDANEAEDVREHNNHHSGDSDDENDDDDNDDDGFQDKGKRAKREAELAAQTGDGLVSKGKYRDSGFYIGHTREESTVPRDSAWDIEAAGRELAAAVLELGAEDNTGMQQGQRRKRWDKKKRRYVTDEGPSSKRGTVFTKTESGKKVESSKLQRGAYDRWVKQSKMRVSATGAAEDPDMMKKLSRRFKPGQHRAKWKQQEAPAGAAAAGVAKRGGELKTPDQVRKQRRVKEKRALRLQNIMAKKAGAAKGGGRANGAPQGRAKGGGKGGKGKMRR